MAVFLLQDLPVGRRQKCGFGEECLLLGSTSTREQKGEGRSGGAQERDTEKAALLQAEMGMETLGSGALPLPAAQHPQRHRAHGAGVSTALILTAGSLV